LLIISRTIPWGWPGGTLPCSCPSCAIWFHRCSGSLSSSSWRHHN